jgi:amidase
MAEPWKEIARRKQEERWSRIPKQWRLSSPPDETRLNVLDVPRESSILSAEELRLTEQFDATALVSGLSTGLLTSVDVVTAFCKRAAIAQQVTNCLTEIFFDDALTRAKELDEYLSRTGKPIGPLHGLPISLKDTFKVKGYDASVGVAAFCFEAATTNSALVDVLLSLGAVLYCKTNVPLTMMALDSHNNVFGRTLNPANKALTAGGSSGGEGALVAMRGSVLGVGTDIGGSIRVPAIANGVYGVKPSHGRVPYAGQVGGGLPGSNKMGIESTAGPIAVSQRDCELLLRSICDARPSDLDAEVVSQSWIQQNTLSNREQGQPRLRVGLMRTDGHVTPLPPIQRLLDEVAGTLSASRMDIEVVEIDVSKIGPRCLKTFNGVMSWEGANTWFDHIEKTGEPMSPWLATRLKRRPQKSLNEVRTIQAQRTELHEDFLSVWRQSGGHWRSSSSSSPIGEEKLLDVIICPGAPHPAAAIDRWNTTNYTSMFNLLDLPAGILPVRKFVDGDMQGELPSTSPLNGWDKINREMWDGFDRKIYLGSTLTIQVVAPRLEERKLVESMSIIDEALRLSRTSVEKSKL